MKTGSNPEIPASVHLPTHRIPVTQQHSPYHYAPQLQATPTNHVYAPQPIMHEVVGPYASQLHFNNLATHVMDKPAVHSASGPCDTPPPPPPTPPPQRYQDSQLVTEKSNSLNIALPMQKKQRLSDCEKSLLQMTKTPHSMSDHGMSPYAPQPQYNSPTQVMYQQAMHAAHGPCGPPPPPPPHTPSHPQH